MAWEKVPDATIAKFEAVLPGPPVERRKMFGCPCAFVNGNMFIGVHESNLMLRLSEADRAELAALGGKQFAPMGRPMREYLIPPASIIDDVKALKGWVKRALEFAKSLPAKEKKAKAAKKAASDKSPKRKRGA